MAEGVSKQMFIQMASNHSMKTSVFTPKGAETLQEVKNRATEFLNSIIYEIGHSHSNNCCGHTHNCNGSSSGITQNAEHEMHEEQKQQSQLATVLIVSHGGVIRQLLLYFVEDLESDFPSGSNRQLRFVSPNTGISKFKIFINEETKLPEFVKCICLHSTEHLTKFERSK